MDCNRNDAMSTLSCSVDEILADMMRSRRNPQCLETCTAIELHVGNIMTQLVRDYIYPVSYFGGYVESSVGAKLQQLLGLQLNGIHGPDNMCNAKCPWTPRRMEHLLRKSQQDIVRGSRSVQETIKSRLEDLRIE